MDLVDAIAANTTAGSPVELSLSALFRRDYSALYKGIQELNRTTQTESTEGELTKRGNARVLTTGKIFRPPFQHF